MAFALGLALLGREARGLHWSEVRAEVLALPALAVALAASLAAASYLVQATVEGVVLRSAGVRLPARRVLATGLVAQVLAANVGVAMLSGGAVRFRSYASAGVDGPVIARIIASISASFWMGYGLLVAGIFLALGPALPAGMPPSRLIGALAALGLLGILVASARYPTWTVRGATLQLPSTRTLAGLMGLASLDWLLAALCVAVLVGAAGGPGFEVVIPVVLAAHLVGAASQVPGGVGVFEGAVALQLSGQLPAQQVLGVLVVFRLLYYLLPLALVATALAVASGARAARKLAPLRLSGATPVLAAGAVFGAGAVLLVSGSLPGVRPRLAWLSEILPLWVGELSHFLASIIGVGLLLLSQALYRRLAVAWWVSVVALAAGGVLSLLKGADFEEAAVLAVVLALLVAARERFSRRAALAARRFDPGWTAAVLGVVLAAGWLVWAMHGEGALQDGTWWRFAWSAEAPRSLRALVGAAVVLLIAATAQLLLPAPQAPAAPTPADLEAARAVVRTSTHTDAHLVLLGDKRLLWNEAGTAFVMFGVQGNCWIAMGDVVGPPETHEELVWRFRECAWEQGATPVFYQATPEDLPLYLDLGFALHKLGEAARVELAGFSLEGGSRKGLRSTRNQLQKAGATVRLLPASEFPAWQERLQAVSDGWMEGKNVREKGFSLGGFDPDYLRHTDFAVVEVGGVAVAFANLWFSAEKHAASLDLMRFGPDAPRGTMEYLFLELILAAKERGFAWFELGMAPLSGLEEHHLAPLWHRLGRMVFDTGEELYNFQGLRSFKDKFHPQWEPRYLAAPRGLGTARALRDVAALISGGFAGIFGR